MSLAEILGQFGAPPREKTPRRKKTTAEPELRYLGSRALPDWKIAGRVAVELVVYDREGPWMPFDVVVQHEGKEVAIDTWTIERSKAELFGWIKPKQT